MATQLNTVRVSKANDHQLPIKSHTLYRWHHLKKHPEIFIKFGGLFVDIDKLNELMERGRGK